MADASELLHPDQFGFNSEVSHRDRTYHVQTECLDDIVPPAIHTAVFLRGALIHKESTTYSDLAGRADALDELAVRVKRQHLGTLARIKAGSLPART